MTIKAPDATTIAGLNFESDATTNPARWSIQPRTIQTVDSNVEANGYGALVIKSNNAGSTVVNQQLILRANTATPSLSRNNGGYLVVGGVSFPSVDYHIISFHCFFHT